MYVLDGAGRGAGLRVAGQGLLHQTSLLSVMVSVMPWAPRASPVAR